MFSNLNLIMKRYLQTFALVIIHNTCRVGWWGGLLVCVLGVPVITYQVLSGTYPKFNVVKVPVKFNEIWLTNLEGQSVKGLFTSTGVLNVRFYNTGINGIIKLLFAVAALGAMLIIFYQVKKMSKSFWRDQPFDKFNLKRVRIVAFVLIAYFIGIQLYNLFTKQIVLSQFPLEHMKLALYNGVEFLWAGIIILVLEEAFARGVVLEEEEQLTI